MKEVGNICIGMEGDTGQCTVNTVRSWEPELQR